MQESLGIVFAFGQAIFWAATSIMLRTLSTRVDPFVVNGLRAAIGLLVVLPLAWLTGGMAGYSAITPLHVVYLASSVIIGGVLGDAMYVSSLKILGINRGFPISNSYPVFTVIASVFLLGEVVTLPMLAGLVLVMLGVALVARPSKHVTGMDQPELETPQLVRGVALGIVTAIFWGISGVLFALGLRGVDSNVANTLRLPIVILVSLAIGYGRGATASLRTLDRRVVGLLIFSGLLGWGIGGTLFAAAVQLAGASKTSIIGAAAPLFGVPLSMVFLHERPTRYTLVGTVLTIAGVVLVV